MMKADTAPGCRPAPAARRRRSVWSRVICRPAGLWLSCLLLVLSAGGMGVTAAEHPDAPSDLPPGIFSETSLVYEANGLSYGTGVAIEAGLLVIGAPNENITGGDPVPNAGAVHVYEPAVAEGGPWNEIAVLHASDPQSGARFGGSVAVSGDVIVVGARWWDSNYPANDDRGAAYVFERDAGGPDNWGETARLEASSPVNDAEFGTAVAVAGNYIVVGAPDEDIANIRAGAVYLFGRSFRSTVGWVEVKRRTATTTEAGAEFGKYVAISGTTAVVGARREDGAETDTGAAYVFEKDQGGVDNWGLARRLSPAGLKQDDRFGGAVDIDGDVLIIGASGTDTDTSSAYLDAGAAYIFGRNVGAPGNWGPITWITGSDSNYLDGFGVSVAISGEIVAVGAAGEGYNGGASPVGAVYIFEQDLGGAGVWGQGQKIYPITSIQTNSAYAQVLSLSGNELVVGAPFYNPPGSGNSGAAYTYERVLLLPTAFIPVVRKP